MDVKAAKQRDSSRSLDSLVSTRGTILFGYAIAALFILAFLGWGGSIPLTSAAIASGVVSVEGHKKQIQHLEGGIVKEIHVRNGDIVTAGQVLLTLNDVEVRSEFNELQNRYILASTEYARWTAEQSSSSTIEVPAWLNDVEEKEAVAEAIERQTRILQARADVLRQAKDSLTHRINESSQEASAGETRIAQLQRKRRLINKELVEFEKLRLTGLATRSQIFDLEKQITNIDIEIEDSRAEIELARQKMTQYAAMNAELDGQRISESTEQAALALKEMQTLRQQLVSISHQLERSSIKAPISGYIMNSAVNTVGGVVLAGDTIMEILPKDERLLVNGRVPPKDRDAIRVGQRAEIRFSAFSRRATLPVEGTVKLISADSVVDPVTSLPYYSTTIELIGDPSDALNGEPLFPGMQADILIITGAQTFLQYLASPITRSFNRAFRET